MLGKNIQALKVQRSLSETTSSLASTFERLSSGLRINTASDDAAGLAISTNLKADKRVYSQAIRNVNDGVSLLNIADSALSSLTSIVTRLQELAQQSSNGTYSDSQRSALDNEAQALRSEYFRISQSASFNGLNLFGGSVQGVSLQTGYSSILSSLGGSLGTGTFGASTSYTWVAGSTIQALEFGDINGDGILDAVGGGAGNLYYAIGNGDGTFAAPTSISTVGVTARDLRLTDINNDGQLDVVGFGTDESNSIAYVSLGNSNGTFGAVTTFQMYGTDIVSGELGDINGDGKVDIVSVEGNGRISIRLGNGDGTFSSLTSTSINNISIFNIDLRDVNGDGALDILAGGIGSGGSQPGVLNVRLGNGNGTFASSQSYSSTLSAQVNDFDFQDLNGDGILDAILAGWSSGGPGSPPGAITVLLGNSNGSFGAGTGYSMTALGVVLGSVSLADLDGDGNLDVVGVGTNGVDTGTVSIRLGNGDGTFRSSSTYSTEIVLGTYDSELRDLNGDGVPDLALSGAVGANGGLSIRLANTRDGVHPLLPFSLATIADAKQAIGQFETAFNNLLLQRGEVGAFQSRLSTTLKHMSGTVLEYEGARSRIEDVDIAQESAELVRKSILQQAASAVLAQANQSPQIALKLLGSETQKK